MKAEAFDELGKHADTTNTNITLETSVDIRYTYDNNGNLTQKNDYSTGTAKTTTYVYSNANLLIQVNLPDSKWEKYYYDGLGRRYKEEVNDGQTTTTKQYVFAGGFTVRELDGAVSPTLAREYIGDGRRVLYGKDGQNNFYYPHYDRDINVTSITNGSGNEVTFYEYDAFGNVIAMAGPDLLGIGFRSGRLAAGSNLLFSNGNYHDPQAGRGLQPRSPRRRSLNLYAATEGPESGGPFLWSAGSVLTMGLVVILWLRRRSAARSQIMVVAFSAAGVCTALVIAIVLGGCGGTRNYHALPNCTVAVFGGHGWWCREWAYAQAEGEGDMRRFGLCGCGAGKTMDTHLGLLAIDSGYYCDDPYPFPYNYGLGGALKIQLDRVGLQYDFCTRRSQAPLVNAGMGGGYQGFFNYNKAAIDAAIQEAQQLAEDCKCQCDMITVRYIGQTAKEGAVRAQGRLPWDADETLEVVPCKKNAKRA